MTILNPKHRGVRQAIAECGLDKLPLLGKGWFCMAFDNGKTVLKLTCDSVQASYYTDRLRPEGRYFPRLVKDHGVVGEQYEYNLHLIEMEKLQAFGKRAACPDRAWGYRKTLLDLQIEYKAKLMDRHWHIKNPADYHRNLSADVLYEMSCDERLTDGLQEACGQLSMFVSNFDAAMDFKPSNFMLRGKTIVLNDVMADIESICARKTRVRC